MAKRGADLALVVPEGLFGGKGGGGGGKRPMHAEPDADESGGPSDMDADDSGGGEFDVAAEEFLDDTLPMEDRKRALHRAIMACMNMGEEY